MAESSLRWPVEYARFMSHPAHDSLCSAHPLLKQLPARRRKRPGSGEWLKIAGTTAIVRLVTTSFNDSTLVVSIDQRPVEEHFVSKLHFSWPQMSCVSQSVIRGSRSLFASYKDSAGVIQRFALLFLDGSESQSFVKSLKESLKHVTSFGASSINATLHDHTQNGLNMQLRPDIENPIHPTVNQDPAVPSSLGGIALHASPEETRLPTNHQEVYHNLPPSITAVPADRYTEAQQDTIQMENGAEEVNPKSLFAKQMKGSSFQEMLIMMEKVISDMGGDMALQMS